jgi:large subunit ribosomal protein L1
VGGLEFDATVATPEMMGKSWQVGAGPYPGHARPDAQPQSWDGCARRRYAAGGAKKQKPAGSSSASISTANLHVPIGKASFDEKMLFDNMAALMEAVRKARPPATKGTFIRRVTLTTTMGPGIKVDPAQAQGMEVRE